MQPGRTAVRAGTAAPTWWKPWDIAAHADSPRNRLGAIESGRRFTGGMVEDWHAPDISGGPSSTVADWSADRLALYLRTGKTEGFVAGGPMAEVIRDGLSHLTKADARAIADYLKDLPDEANAGSG